MKADEREIRRKRRILDHALETGHVAQTCRYFGIPRSLFYLWRNTYQKHGQKGLRRKKPLALRLADGPTVADLAARYLDEHVAARCKPKTAAMYRLIVEKHIVPALGKLPALAVGQARVTELHHGLSEPPVMANQVVDTLSRIFNTAEDRGLVPEGTYLDGPSSASALLPHEKSLGPPLRRLEGLP